MRDWNIVKTGTNYGLLPLEGTAELWLGEMCILFYYNFFDWIKKLFEIFFFVTGFIIYAHYYKI